MRVETSSCGFVLVLEDSSILVKAVSDLRPGLLLFMQNSANSSPFPDPDTWLTECLYQCRADNGIHSHDASLFCLGAESFTFTIVVRVGKTGPHPGNFQLCFLCFPLQNKGQNPNNPLPRVTEIFQFLSFFFFL